MATATADVNIDSTLIEQACVNDKKTAKAGQVKPDNFAQENETLEGGWGWCVVAAAFIIMVIVFGTLRCQSVLFVPIMNQFNALYSSVGWIAALATLGFAIAGLISAPLMSKFGHRTTVVIGGFVAATSYLLSMLLLSVGFLDIFAGFTAGIGLGISFVCAPVLIGFYFKKRRALATNIASTGGSVGTFIICPLNGILVDSYGLQGYFLIMAGVFMNLTVAGALMRPVALSLKLAKARTKERSSTRKVVEVKLNADGEALTSKEEVIVQQAKPWTSLLRNPAYIVYCVSQLVFLSGFLVNQLYIVPFAQIELGVPVLRAPLIMSISAGTEILSRIAFGILGDIKRIDRILMFSSVLLALAVCALIIPFTKSFVSLAAMSAVTGLFQGGFSGISVVILADIVGLQLYGSALGISTFLNGIGTLISPPLVGIAVDRTKRPSTALLISAAILFVGAFATFMIKVALQCGKSTEKEKDEREVVNKRA